MAWLNSRISGQGLTPRNTDRYDTISPHEIIAPRRVEQGDESVEKNWKNFGQHDLRCFEAVRAVVPGIVQYTTDVLFRDLWLRPDLAPRDRRLVTVSALIASGQVAQIPYHLNRAMDNGLSYFPAQN